MSSPQIDNAYFRWHSDQCALMKAWPKLAVAVAELRQAVVRFSVVSDHDTGDIVQQWDVRLDPVYALLSDIEREAGVWYEETIEFKGLRGQ